VLNRGLVPGDNVGSLGGLEPSDDRVSSGFTSRLLSGVPRRGMSSKGLGDNWFCHDPERGSDVRECLDGDGRDKSGVSEVDAWSY